MELSRALVALNPEKKKPSVPGLVMWRHLEAFQRKGGSSRTPAWVPLRIRLRHIMAPRESPIAPSAALPHGFELVGTTEGRLEASLDK